ncbi:MAG TPA: tryptophan--tRNA ligase [Dermatophilaceae bacterium]|jgi:tryptophanyl-tRNA synthetase|uniref:Tryptophan--tRNA ligase n=1 Tax=Candidatus Phosphoribacter hodrii TaxID=2953743 RepID=A0A935CCM8_9MICO|nr:tryptophan--tRNA ligase [Candidatus Phosphoribacter hodrii]OPZ56371.1 MAG: Tryptophan--tRNA ligase [bacterium ADurb.BinA028]HOA02050.1 tryptophan--tRNA ligase [Dermatophilaceae bacterium]HQG11160.1 tryptophan--tRNA ligase [Dermatophilaceae bacterium]HQH90556.1 tryptophan--tRNA ligase [Dermatophilaceae bacterium]
MTTQPSGIPPRSRPRSLSGMQPTSDSLHIGNYVGALVNWVELQETYDAFYFVADLHALTVPTGPAVLRRRTQVTAAQFIAAGVDPERSAVFCQSHLPQHAELGWVMSCLTAMGEASRMTQFKDKTAKGQQGNVGLFTYPMLMAADILIYDADKVPVGEDQRQHLEITRDLALRFNQRYGQTLVVPEPHILKQTAKIMELTDPTSKMSGTNSPDAGVVLLSDDPKRITKKIKSAVTDAEMEIRYDPENKPGVSNLLVIQSALTGVPIPALEAGYAGQGYGALKTQVAEVVVAAAEPFQRRMAELLDDPAELDRVLARGAERAGAVSAATLARVKDRMGLLPAAH